MKNKKVLVVGLGKSGVSAINTLYEVGAKVYIYDKNLNKISEKVLLEIKGKVEIKLQDNYEKYIEQMDFIVVSPGVPLDEKICQYATTLGKKIIGELELAYLISKSKFIGITGTNGKTTTTTLVGEIFKNAGIKSDIVGNIGKAVAQVALTSEEDEYLITEISSFQLETIEKFKPEIATILNLTPDHLDRHKTVEEYGKIKARIFENMNDSDFLIVNGEDVEIIKLVERCEKAKVLHFSSERELEEGFFVKDDIVKIRYNGKDLDVCKKDEIKIRGKHNLENALAAIGICYLQGIDIKYIQKTLKEFKGVEHRLETVMKIDEVEFINDSKGTNTDASIKAVEALKENIILIAGGYDKGADFTDFIKSFNGRVKSMVLLGETANKIKSQGNEVGFTEIFIEKNMENCVKKAFQLSSKGDKILLSPACASWDMYINYEQRGEDFKTQVKSLKKKDKIC